MNNYLFIYFKSDMARFTHGVDTHLQQRRFVETIRDYYARDYYAHRAT